MMSSVESITDVLDAEVREILTDIADTPLPDEAAEQSTEDAAEEEQDEDE